MKIDDLIKHYGSISACARAFDVSRPTIYRWERTGMPPQISRAIDIGKDLGVSSFVEKVSACGEDKQQD